VKLSIEVIFAAAISSVGCSAILPADPSGGSESEVSQGTANDPGSSKTSGLSKDGPRAKDFAIVFRKQDSDLVRADSVSAAGTEFFNVNWYRAMFEAYKANDFQPVGFQPRGSTVDIEKENQRGEWSNVSARVEPCSPLGIAPFQSEDELCWPELRLVWQPIKRDFQLTRRLKLSSYADDRGAHTLFDVEPAAVLRADDAALASAIMKKVRAAATSGTWTTAAGYPLTPAERATFIRLRNLAAERLLRDAQALRSSSADIPADAFDVVGPRPELTDATERAAFMVRYTKFLGIYARPSALKQLTSFSLRAGRTPGFGWLGLFVSLRPGPTGLVQVAEPLYSAADGTPLFNVPITDTVNAEISAFDVTLGGLTVALAKTNPSGLAELVRDAPVYDPARNVTNYPSSTGFVAIQERARDRRRVGTSNTPCITCHQLDVQVGDSGRQSDKPSGIRAFNFHNLSSLTVPSVALPTRIVEDEFHVSSRVTAEVDYDLQWTKLNL